MKVSRQASQPLQALADKVEGQRIAMLTLAGEGGELSARPLTTLEMDDQGCFWFLVSRATMQPLLGSGAACNLAFSDEGNATYVSVVGDAALVEDAGLRHALWSVAARPWFPGGPDDPNLTLLRVSPRRAEVWDSPHSSVVRLAAMAASIAAARPIGLGEKTELQASGPR